MPKKDRDDMKTQLQSLVYGETEFRTLGYVFEKIKTVYGRPNQVRKNFKYCRGAECGIMQHSTLQYSRVQYSKVHYSTVQYSTVEYSTV